MKRFLLLLLILISAARAADTNSLEFLEAFSWGDRESALKELVPDTEDYFYYHCLHYQLSNDRPAFHDMLRRWLNHHKGNWNSRMHLMRRRQMLIEFDRNPDQTWRFIRDDQNLRFNHHPRRDRGKPNLPSTVNPDRYGFDVFLRNAAAHNGILDDVTERGLEVMVDRFRNPDERRAWLGRIQRPDFPGLVDIILADLEYKNSRGFGHHSIHRLLTRDQLEELGRRQPDLLRDGDYVTERLSRIQPPEVDLSHDHEAAIAYYRELWDFVESLGSMHNSLKASTLYRLLDHQRKTGQYDEALFRDYLALPRRVYYIRPELQRSWQRQRAEWVNFNYAPGRSIVLPPIRGEEPLVRDFLLTLLRNDPSTESYNRFFETNWLNAIFAESKILAGEGNPEDWANLLTPAAYRNILDRVELTFAPENPAYITPGEEVSLQVDVKRVDSLLMKIYELQTFNYYTTHRAPVDQAVDLDGMIPTHERTLDVSADPGVRVRHTLDVPEVSERGVYVVELIGNGVSSRALVHVGHLESITQPTSAGQAVMVLNEAGDTVKNARLWMNEREFEADERGVILLPYSQNPGVKFAILRDGGFSSPEQVQHLGETYRFTAGIHIDRQSLNHRSTGLLILRPQFRIHGVPLNPERLGDVDITLTATNAKGVKTERNFTARFEKATEWAREFYVPQGLRQVTVSVKAGLKRATDLEEVTLTDSYTLNVNGARTGDKLRQVFLVPHADGWSLEVRGLNGEPVADETLQLDFFHPAFTDDVDVSVITDEQGRVKLGSLAGLHRLRVSGHNLSLDMPLEGGGAVFPSRLHLRPGEPVSLPYPLERTADLRRASLFRVGRGLHLEDLGERVSIEDGQLVIPGLPEGKYTLHLHEAGANIALEVLEGETRSGYLLGDTRRLQQNDSRYASVEGVERDGDEFTVRLRNPSNATRVAVRAFRYLGPGGAFPVGFGFTPPAQRTVYPPHVQYISGREIGDEYRYVLERKTREIFAGTLLERPGLILNPWMLRETEAEREQLKQDEAYRGGRQQMNEVAEMPAPSTAPASFERGFGGVGSDAFGDVGIMDSARKARIVRPAADGNIGFDFLPVGSRWWVNLRPDDTGRITLPLEGLEEHTALEIVVVDRFGIVRTRLPMPFETFEPRDVRLTSGLNPDADFSRQKKVRQLTAGEEAVFPDLATARYQVIRSVGQAFDILQTLSGNDNLSKFSFLKEWPSLDEETKLTKYADYASHEFHLFVHERDRDFFNRVVRPYLANKKDKTFVDRWLLDELRPEDTRLDTLGHRNALELALLARRGGNAEAIREALGEANELNPPDPDGFSRRVRVALLAGELDEARALARDELVERAKRESSSLTGKLRARSMERNVSADYFGAPAAMEEAEAAPAELEDMSFSMESPAVIRNDELLTEYDDDGGFENRKARLYRALPRTKEWVEQNYYEVRRSANVPARIKANDFWLDIASGEAVSSHLLQAHGTLTEVIAAVALSGLPFEAEEPVETPEGAQMTVKVSSPAVLVSEQILPAELSGDDRPLLLSQQVFRPDDMYRFEGNERIEKFVTGEFIRRTVYGTRVTLTNPTASRRRLNVLLQIPLGAIPLRNGFYTDDQSVVLDPYTTKTVEYFFTFPESGEFGQFPAHAAAREEIIGQADPRVYRVVDAPTEVDKTSWAWISQNGSNAETLEYMREHNLRRTDLNEIAWRLKDRGFFQEVVDLLESRLWYHPTTYSYGVYHENVPTAQVWLANSAVAKNVGPVFDSPLLTVEPFQQKTYEHLEYDPLVNPRAHEVGEKRKILNLALRQQYRKFLFVNMYREQLTGDKALALVYYLQLQGRLAEAIETLDGVEADSVDETLQTDYLKAWLALRTLDTGRALALATPHVEHPVPRWRQRFSALVAAVEEAGGGEAAEVADPTRQQDLNRMAAQEPALDLEAVSGELRLSAYNLSEVEMNLYPMDIELLFSRKPFLAEGGADFAVIKPALTRTLKVDGDGEMDVIRLPAAYRDRNLMVEITGKGKRASVAWYANRLKVRTMENFGQVEVRSEKGRPLPKTYVKVFARGVNGRVSFWKDGYTDLRGRFDYLSLNHRKPEEAAEFSILILHPDHGAEIKQAVPPTR